MRAITESDHPAIFWHNDAEVRRTLGARSIPLGRGIGRQFQKDLCDHARAQAIPTVTCEYDIEPLNPVSRAFHACPGRRRRSDHSAIRRRGVESVADRPLGRFRC
jgi:predicted GNAT superfamily acetyltransferase